MPNKKMFVVVGPEPAIPGSQKVNCSRCGQGCWVAPGSASRRARGASVICWDCFEETYEDGPVRICPEALVEMGQFLGRPFTLEEALMDVAGLQRWARERRVGASSSPGPRSGGSPGPASPGSPRSAPSPGPHHPLAAGARLAAEAEDKSGGHPQAPQIGPPSAP